MMQTTYSFGWDKNKERYYKIGNRKVTKKEFEKEAPFLKSDEEVGRR